MATVGLGDVYRYGAKFVGYLLVVAVVAGVFVVGGAYLASEVMTITDPSPSALSETQAFVGAFVMAIGALLGTIGLFGLAHKLLTESMERALAAHARDGVFEVADTDAASAEGEPEDEATSEPEPAGEPARTPDRESAEPDPEPEPRQPTPPEPAAAESPAGQAVEPEPATEDSPGDQPLYGEPIDDEPKPAHESAGVDDRLADEPPVGGDGAPATDVQDGPVDTTERAGPADEVDDSPPEWTPPDPSEFETPDEEPVDGGNGDAVEDAEPMGEPESEPEPAPEPEPEPSDVDEIPDDATLADEGVEGFEAGSEDDPLADRLPSDEE